MLFFTNQPTNPPGRDVIVTRPFPLTRSGIALKNTGPVPVTDRLEQHCIPGSVIPGSESFAGGHLTNLRDSAPSKKLYFPLDCCLLETVFPRPSRLSFLNSQPTQHGYHRNIRPL